MARPRQRAQTRHQFSRTDRIRETVREIVATELERIGDERLELVTVTDVAVDPDLATAKVFYSALTMTDDGRAEDVAAAFEEVRWTIQQAVNRGIRARKTPQLSFRPDEVLAAALRIDDIVAGRIRPADETDRDNGG